MRAQRDGEVGAEDIGTVSKRYKQLNDAEADQLDDLIKRQDDDGIRLAGDIESDALSDLLSCGSGTVGGGAVYATSAGARVSQSSGCTLDTDFLDAVADVNGKVDDFDAQAFARRYNKLEGDNERQFRELAKNDDYGDSFVRAAADDGVDSDGLRETLAIVESVDDSVEIREFSSAQLAYARAGEDDYLSEWYPERAGGSKAFFNPYSENGIVIDARTTSEDTVLVRAYSNSGPSGPTGAFYTDGEDMLRTIENPDQTIEGRYALPGGNKDKIATLDLDENTNVRVSAVGANEMGPGGGIQYEIREPSLKDDVNSLNQDDYPGTFEVDKSRDNLQSALEESLE